MLIFLLSLSLLASFKGHTLNAETNSWSEMTRRIHIIGTLMLVWVCYSNEAMNIPNIREKFHHDSIYSHCLINCASNSILYITFFTFAFDQFHLWYAPELMEFQAFKWWRFIWQTIFSASSFSHFHVVEWGRKNALKISCGVFSFLFFIECASFISWEFVSNWTSERAEVQWFIIHASWCASSELLTLHPCNEFHLRDIRLWIYDFIRSMNASSCQHWEVGLNTQTLLPKWKFICHIGRKNGKCWEYSSLLNIMLSLSRLLNISWIAKYSNIWDQE